MSVLVIIMFNGNRFWHEMDMTDFMVKDTSGLSERTHHISILNVSSKVIEEQVPSVRKRPPLPLIDATAQNHFVVTHNSEYICLGLLFHHFKP
jgi:hypothetical protein